MWREDAGDEEKKNTPFHQTKKVWLGYMMLNLISDWSFKIVWIRAVLFNSVELNLMN